MRVIFVLACLFISACAPGTDAFVREVPQSGNTMSVDQYLGAGEEGALAETAKCADDQWLTCSTSVNQQSCSCIVDSLVREKLRRMEEISRQPIS